MNYIEAVLAVGQAAETFQKTIQEQDSDAYQKLDGLWETNVKENAEELVSRLNTILDTADEKGIAYSSRYVVADVVIAS